MSCQDSAAPPPLLIPTQNNYRQQMPSVHPHTTTWSSRLLRSSVDSLTKLPFVIDMLPSIVTSTSLNSAVDIYIQISAVVHPTVLSTSLFQLGISPHPLSQTGADPLDSLLTLCIAVPAMQILVSTV